MSEHLHTSLFSESNCISEQQLHGYIDDKLDAQERHVVEKHMLSCELCADAMEGLSLVKNRKIVDDTVVLVRNKFSKKTEVKEPLVIPFNYKRAFAIAASVLLLIGAGFMFVHYSSDAQKDVAMNEIIIKDPQNKKNDSVTAHVKFQQPMEKFSPLPPEEKKPAFENKDTWDDDGLYTTKAEETEKSKKETGNFYDWRHDEPTAVETTGSPANSGAGSSANQNLPDKDTDVVPDPKNEAGGEVTMRAANDLQRELTESDKKSKSKPTNNAGSAPSAATSAPVTTSEPTSGTDRTKTADSEPDNSNFADAQKNTLDEVQKQKSKEELRKESDQNIVDEKPGKNDKSVSEKFGYMAEDKIIATKALVKKYEIAKGEGGKEGEALKQKEINSIAGNVSGGTNTEQNIVSNTSTNTLATLSVPEYTGGYDVMQNFIKDNTDFTNCKGCKGTVTLRFIVKTTGKIENIKAVKEVKKCKCLTTESIRIVNKMPAWIPAKQNGTTMDYEYTLPVDFK